MPSALFAEASVWQVQSEQSTLFLGGTIHKLSEDAYPLPQEYQIAYDQSQLVVFETDIGRMQSPDVLAIIAQRSLFSDGESLATALNAETYAELSKYCKEIGFPIDIINSLKPVMAMLTLLAVNLQILGITAQGVDEYYYNIAKADNKSVGTLETVEQQIEYLMELDQGRPNQFVMESIEDLRDARENGSLRKGIEAWYQGDESELYEHFIADQKQNFVELYQALVVNRNLDWLSKIEDYLESADTELVLVGVAHLIGEDSIVSLLRAKGYNVKKL